MPSVSRPVIKVSKCSRYIPLDSVAENETPPLRRCLPYQNLNLIVRYQQTYSDSSTSASQYFHRCACSTAARQDILLVTTQVNLVLALPPPSNFPPPQPRRTSEEA